LQDASPLGDYLGRGQRVDHRHYVQLLRDGYRRYVWPAFASDAPEQVWIIGRGVSTALAGLPRIDPTRVITRPPGPEPSPASRRTSASSPSNAMRQAGCTGGRSACRRSMPRVFDHPSHCKPITRSRRPGAIEKSPLLWRALRDSPAQANREWACAPDAQPCPFSASRCLSSNCSSMARGAASR
jgi:hypothetical protein